MYAKSPNTYKYNNEETGESEDGLESNNAAISPEQYEQVLREKNEAREKLKKLHLVSEKAFKDFKTLKREYEDLLNERQALLDRIRSLTEDKSKVTKERNEAYELIRKLQDEKTELARELNSFRSGRSSPAVTGHGSLGVAVKSPRPGIAKLKEDGGDSSRPSSEHGSPSRAVAASVSPLRSEGERSPSGALGGGGSGGKSNVATNFFNNGTNSPKKSPLYANNDQNINSSASTINSAASSIRSPNNNINNHYNNNNVNNNNFQRSSVHNASNNAAPPKKITESAIYNSAKLGEISGMLSNFENELSERLVKPSGSRVKNTAFVPPPFASDDDEGANEFPQISPPPPSNILDSNTNINNNATNNNNNNNNNNGYSITSGNNNRNPSNHQGPTNLRIPMNDQSSGKLKKTTATTNSNGNINAISPSDMSSDGTAVNSPAQNFSPTRNIIPNTPFGSSRNDQKSGNNRIPEKTVQEIDSLFSELERELDKL